MEEKLQPESMLEEEEKVPELRLEETPSIDIETVIAQDKNEIEIKQEETQLSEKEQKAVEDFSKKIDITNPNLVLQYGSAAQKHIADFSEGALSKVKTKDVGEVGDILADLVVELKGFQGIGKKGFGRNPIRFLQKIKAKYAKAEVNVNQIVGVLENHQVTLLKDIALFGKMYEMNLQYFKELSMYIQAGKLRLKEAEEVELPKLKAQAQQSGLSEDAQKVNDYANMVNRFEKRLYDLELTRTISLQMGPQIRLVQNNDSLMAEKINSSIVNTIPLWKSQMVIAMGLENSRQAIEAQKAVSEMTNKMLRENAKLLKEASVETAKESERGIVDIETLQETNQLLITTIEEVVTIQKEGKQKRKDAEVQLTQMESELKHKLLELAQK